MRGIAQPLEIFRSRNPFNDYSADDMQCGDMSAEVLKQRYGLIAVSNRVDPYSFKKLSFPSYSAMPTLNRTQAAAILFEQLHFEAGRFALGGPYAQTIQRMLTHFQYGDGEAFQDPLINQAYQRMIECDNAESSAKMLILDILKRFNNWDSGLSKNNFSSNFIKAHLPRFNRLVDCINGLGLSIHGINSTRIRLESLKFSGNKFTAVLHYQAQDHFGLDTTDIQDSRFKYLLFFRVWFVLQRYKLLAYKPFFTNMEARVTVTGVNNA
ncbi:DUF3289 family protein [Kalamiella sp. sgz302252]|uniref:DUF3289 family protein n=1 Tax=Pantoea sp. sgz302252 TaxID=3341827 RepID=UPI0036D33779